MPVQTTAGSATLTQLIPIQELTPGAIGVIRNNVIEKVLVQAVSELSLTRDKLIVRDLRPVEDLQMYSAGASAATIEDWVYTSTTGLTAGGWTSLTGSQINKTQRYMAIFGYRDLRQGLGPHATSTIQLAPTYQSPKMALIKINVGGADKVIWDTGCTIAYRNNPVAISPSAVIIPPNISYQIYVEFTTAAPITQHRFQLLGVVIEPRGKIISP